MLGARSVLPTDVELLEASLKELWQTFVRRNVSSIQCRNREADKIVDASMKALFMDSNGAFEEWLPVVDALRDGSLIVLFVVVAAGRYWQQCRQR